MGGEGEIRTRGTLADTPVFKTGPFNHSGTSPVVFKISGEGGIRTLGNLTATHALQACRLNRSRTSP